jgi:hypothetical protein
LLEQPDNAAKIAEVEEKIMDRSKTLIAVIGETMVTKKE